MPSDVLFSLEPIGQPATDAANDVSNQHLFNEATKRLDIGHFRSKSGEITTLATLGRNGDVVMRGGRIAKIQASFETDPETGIIMFYDRSFSHTSQVSGDNATPFEFGRPRKVVVKHKYNTIIGMGGVGCDLFQFRLVWKNLMPLEAMEIAKNRASFPFNPNPDLARTIEDDADTILPSQRVTRIHTSGPQQPKMRYATLGTLGCGNYGVVKRVVNMDTGKLIAMKILKQPASMANSQWMDRLHGKLKREVEILSSLDHAHIVDYITTEGWDTGKVKIFMGLKEGTLQSFVEGGNSINPNKLGETVLNQMLKALDYLAKTSIVHRDIKPANILYVSRPDGPHFQLGDFGISNLQAEATTFTGSMLFMAPEMWNGEQTDKVDVWSLYVTILWTANVEGFRAESDTFKNPDDARKAIQSIVQTDNHFWCVSDMAKIDPEQRPSAADILNRCFKGEGLCIEGAQILPFITEPEAVGDVPDMDIPDTTVLAERSPLPLNEDGPETANGGTSRRPFRIQKRRVSPIQVSPIQVSPIQVSPIQVSPIQVSPIQVSPIQVSPIQALKAAEQCLAQSFHPMALRKQLDPLEATRLKRMGH
ncbi:kinase-like protein [Xylaria arbuscula]|nr:kinase-like protein [Xylaria arbuscula]